MEVDKALELLRNFHNQLKKADIVIGTSAEAVTVLECELNRKLALLEWLLRLNMKRVEKDSKKGINRVLREVKKLQCLIQDQRTNRHVPVITSKGHGALEKFDYLCLPRLLVRTKILEFITDPQDRLNLLEAIPSEAQLVNWPSKEDLQFERDFPMMHYSAELKHLWKYEADYVQMSWSDDELLLWRIAQTSEYRRQVILRHFEQFLTDNIDKSSGSKWNDAEANDYMPTEYEADYDKRSLKNLDFRKCKWKDFPRTQKLEVNFDVFPEDFRKLANRGDCIWNTELCTMGSESVEWSWSTLCRCLSLMPNLRSLTFDDAYTEYEDVGNNGRVGLGPAQLPVLPHLKSLVLIGDAIGTTHVFQYFHRLLEKYGQQLNQLLFDISCPIEIFPRSLPACEALTVLTFVDMTESPGLGAEGALQLLSNLRGSPLKKVKLQMKGVRLKSALYQLLEQLSLNFGSSLEHLELWFGHMEVVKKDDNISATPFSLLHMQFQKVTYFATDVNIKPDGVDFVLVFPVVETLKLPWRGIRLDINKNRFVIKDFQGYHKDKEDFQKSKLWVLLPSLKVIQSAGNNGGKITRKEISTVVKMDVQRGVTEGSDNRTNGGPLLKENIEAYKPLANFGDYPTTEKVPEAVSTKGKSLKLVQLVSDKEPRRIWNLVKWLPWFGRFVGKTN